MAKPLYVYTGSQWVPVASELESTSQYATTTYVDDKVGLDFITTQTISAASSVSFNNVFTSTYDNYLIIGELEPVSNTTLQLRLRVSGSDNTDAQYQRQRLLAGSTTVVASRLTGQTSYDVIQVSSSFSNAFTLKVIKPFITARTTFINDGIASANSTGPEILIVGGGHNVSSSFTGITFLASANFSGQISVYGYKD